MTSVTLSERENTIVIIKGETERDSFAMEAAGDRIIVEEDKFRSGYECKTCDGEGHSNEICAACNGTKIYDGKVCPQCSVRTELGLKAHGYRLCRDCKGAGGLAIPETAKMRPTSGTIRSVGRDVNYEKYSDGKEVAIVDGEGNAWLKVGDRVIYPLFAGTAIDFKQRGVCRILHRNEIMAKIYGVENIGKFIR